MRPLTPIHHPPPADALHVGAAPSGADELTVESLDLEGRGVARDSQGKVVFVEGALPFERVTARIHRRKAAWEQGVVETILRESASRVQPRCPHFGLHAGACGGCKMQHLDASAQVAIKQRVLEDALWHVGRVRANVSMRPLEGLTWGYRDRARLSVRHVVKKGAVLVGFHERKSSYIADMTRCPILAPRVERLLLPLRELVMGMDGRDRLPQIEVAVGDPTVVLVLRHLEPLSADDRRRLTDFAQEHDIDWWLQPKGPDTAAPMDPASARPLVYRLAEFGVTMAFRPTDFTQVNHRVNAVMVSRALGLLNLQPHERAIDWFCGLGNFTLPMAQRCASVLGVEGSEALVARARDNAMVHGLDASTRFEACNLFDVEPAALQAWPSADAWLIDPPREGALALVKALAAMRTGEVPGLADAPWTAPSRIVYVSCNPATLARDAGMLVHQAGYRLEAAGVVNMFAHTAHVESMALFVRGEVPERRLDDQALAGDADVDGMDLKAPT